MMSPDGVVTKRGAIFRVGTEVALGVGSPGGSEVVHGIGSPGGSEVGCGVGSLAGSEVEM